MEAFRNASAIDGRVGSDADLRNNTDVTLYEQARSVQMQINK